MNLNKFGKVFTSKFVATGPSSCNKRIYQTAVSQRLRNTALDCFTCGHVSSNRHFWAHGGTVYRIHNQNINCISIFFLFWRNSPQCAKACLFLSFLYHTQLHTTLGRTPMYEWSAHRRDMCLTTLNIHNRQTSMSPVGFEPIISEGERPQTYALARAATDTGSSPLRRPIFKVV